MSSRFVAAGEASILQTIGNTPLLPIRRIFRSDRVQLFCKAEWFNPGGSVKDRPAYNMIRAGEESGELTPERMIIDATSGNTGIAYAMIGAAKGYRVLLALPENASAERKKILTAYGAELLLTDPMCGTDGAIRAIRALHAEAPHQYFYPDQYSNDANWRAHYLSTAPEIWEQTHGEITHFVAGLGTSGTFMGTTRRLKELSPAVRAISFQPDSPLHGLEGMKHMATAMVPRIYDPALADENLEVSTEDAYDMVLRLCREEGMFVGISSGAAAVAALRVARSLESGLVVAVFPDGGDKYLSENVWR